MPSSEVRFPPDLRRQWIQGTGPAAKPNTPVRRSIRNIAHALLSGADGWMFDGEDALGQVSTMSLDNQRNLKLAIHRDDVFMEAGREVADEMNRWAREFFGRETIPDWQKQLDFTTKIFRPRGLHLDDRHIRRADASGFSASIVDVTLFIVNNQRNSPERVLARAVSAEDSDGRRSRVLERHARPPSERQLGLPIGTIKAYVLVEQIETCFQLMEIRAALGPALRRVQHRPLGLHQQRRPTRWRGIPSS